ncbi:LytR/AlgR family response regulator transcription factor [Peribacillus sp. SCS-26]|uniref:LytR/AlgR family response regulator transcription factor n=1 Tax=Paraperibacillus marinus TaxID=3115295 RepID=UPI00390687DD
MMKAFIVDDEPLARDELKYLLARTREVETAGEAGSMIDALEQIKQLKPDLIFLDIELSEDSGLELAGQIRRLDFSPAIIFATAYDEFALKAFELDAVDYVLKPFDEDRIRQTIHKIKALRGTAGPEAEASAESRPMPAFQTGKLAVYADERIILVDTGSIVYLASAEGRTVLKTMEAEYKMPEALSAVEKKLTNLHMIRVHRSYLVNVDYIAEIQPWFNSTYNLIMKEGTSIPVSRTYVKDLKHLLGF